MKSRPKFARVSEAMKEWSALLEAELVSWPGVTTRSMFGMTVFYRERSIFAALPRTRSFESPQSVAFKLYRRSPSIQKLLRADPQFRGLEPGVRWITYALQNERDLAGALRWFGVAYRMCASGRTAKK